MSSVLPQTRPLGDRRLYETLFREVFTSDTAVSINDVRSYCLGRLYRAGSQLDGALELLQKIDVLAGGGSRLRIHRDFLRELSGRDTGVVIAKWLLRALVIGGEIEIVFPPGSLSIGAHENELLLHVARVSLQGLPAIRLMRDLGVVSDTTQSTSLLAIRDPFVDILKSSLAFSVTSRRSRKSLSPEQLQSIQEAQERQGAAAEEFVLDFERRRLEGHLFLNLIERVSTTTVSAGYDIESFEGLDSFLPNRFIEVKSFADTEGFYISQGELQAARELGDAYHIYLVNSRTCNNDGYVPLIIRNPAKELFREEGPWVITPVDFRVERPVQAK